MPKLNNIQIAEGLRKRIAELENGTEIAAKDYGLCLLIS